jgi:anti-sigma regulatory factor (Ser/Thr protein kinase)
MADDLTLPQLEEALARARAAYRAAMARVEAGEGAAAERDLAIAEAVCEGWYRRVLEAGGSGE